MAGDPVLLFERMGVHTGVDLHRLVAARAVLQRGLPPGFVDADAGLPDAAPLRAQADGAPA